MSSILFCSWKVESPPKFREATIASHRGTSLEFRRSYNDWINGGLSSEGPMARFGHLQGFRSSYLCLVFSTLTYSNSVAKQLQWLPLISIEVHWTCELMRIAYAITVLWWRTDKSAFHSPKGYMWTHILYTNLLSLMLCDQHNVLIHLKMWSIFQKVIVHSASFCSQTNKQYLALLGD